MLEEIERYFGTYTGLCPTDGSKIAMGEIQLTINEQGLTIRHATGIKINEDSVPLSEVRPLTEGELRSQFNEGSNEHTRVDGFFIHESFILLFWRKPAKRKDLWFWRRPAEARLVIRFGEFIEILGITMLYDEAQVAHGDFEYMIKTATKAVGDYPFPRLKFEGRHEPGTD